MSSFEFNAVLLNISNQLSGDELNKIKFLCQDMVGKRELEKIDTGLRLFRILLERGRLGVGQRDCLIQLLRQIERHDLSDMLTRFESELGSTDNRPDEREEAKLDIATEIIAENVGSNWRKLGRKLGLIPVKLDSISRRHPTDLEETAVELLKEWRKSRGAEAQTEELINALRDCQYNLTADKVVERLASL